MQTSKFTWKKTKKRKKKTGGGQEASNVSAQGEKLGLLKTLMKDEEYV